MDLSCFSKLIGTINKKCKKVSSLLSSLQKFNSNLSYCHILLSEDSKYLFLYKCVNQMCYVLWVYRLIVFEHWLYKRNNSKKWLWLFVSFFGYFTSFSFFADFVRSIGCSVGYRQMSSFCLKKIGLLFYCS
jgi:multidrug transporter EmrE-like cation transporter